MGEEGLRIDDLSFCWEGVSEFLKGRAVLQALEVSLREKAWHLRGLV